MNFELESDSVLKPDTEHVAPILSVESESSSVLELDPAITLNPESRPVSVPTQEPTQFVEVFRWVLGAVPSKLVMKKLHAICVLAEGKTPIRVINRKGEILVSESEEILVDAARFQVLAELFGVG